VQVLGEHPGCGFFITPDFILTCAHVLGRQLREGATVELMHWIGGEPRTLQPATVFKVFPDDDISILKAATQNPSFVLVGGEASVGNTLIAVGFPRRGGHFEFDQFQARYEGLTRFFG
jgi:hypothetical protein